MTTPPPVPNTIRQLQRAAYPGYALLAGIQLDLFSALAIGPKSVSELAGELSLDEEKLQILMYVLASTGLLSVQDGCFSNSAEAEVFLVKGGPDYLGEEFEAFSDRWAQLSKTAESVRSGKAMSKVDYTSMSPEELQDFYMANHSQNLDAGKYLLAQFDFTECQRLLDVGGGTGGLAIAIAEACPWLTATVLDLPNVIPVTRRFIAEAGAGESVEVVTGDVTKDDLPKGYDAAAVKNFIPVVSKAQAQCALNNVAQCLNPGGMLYMIDNGILDDSRLTPIGVVTNSLFFLNVFDDGGPRSEGERRQWLSEAGFVDVERSTLSPTLGVMVARKLS